MALTEHCDVLASVSETLINALAANVARQRPSMFNYGTQSFAASPGLMCHPIEVAAGLPKNQPLVTPEQPIPVPGTAGAWAFEWCAQLTKLEIDFAPSNRFALPPELGAPSAQSIALHAAFCAALACPSGRVLAAIAPIEAAKYPALDPARAIRGDRPAPTTPSGRERGRVLPIDRERIHCFCLELFATARLVIDGAAGGAMLRIELTGLEIVDIKPDGLEQSLECLVAATIALGVLPRFRLALDDILLGLGEYGVLSIGLTPTSPSVPFNPSIDGDRLSVFVDVDLS